MTDEFKAWLLGPREGCSHVRMFPEAGIYTAVKRLLFHYTLILGQIGNRQTYDDRWCYQTEEAAVAAMEAWDATAGGEPENWHRHPTSGRRRVEADPHAEYRAW